MWAASVKYFENFLLERSVFKWHEAFCMFLVWEYIDGLWKILSDSGSGFPVRKFSDNFFMYKNFI